VPGEGLLERLARLREVSPSAQATPRIYGLDTTSCSGGLGVILFRAVAFAFEQNVRPLVKRTTKSGL
jgi:hypothetical protein